MDREESLALLRDQHQFPGRFEFRAFVKPGAREAVESAVGKVGDDKLVVLEVVERPSRTGKWMSLKLGVHVCSAEDVLAVYAALHGHEDVVLTM